MKVAPRSRIDLPSQIEGPFEVFVNGVKQEEGRDFNRVGGHLVFQRSLTGEGKLGFWRWLSLFLGVAGTYRQNDSVDVVYQHDGRRLVATGLSIVQEPDV
jgi:hypothetical protein